MERDVNKAAETSFALVRLLGDYLVLPVIRILLGSMTRQARPAVWMVRRAELSWTM